MTHIMQKLLNEFGCGFVSFQENEATGETTQFKVNGQSLKCYKLL